MSVASLDTNSSAEPKKKRKSLTKISASLVNMLSPAGHVKTVASAMKVGFVVKFLVLFNFFLNAHFDLIQIIFKALMCSNQTKYVFHTAAV